MIRRFFTYHPYMKLFSLLFASLLWFIIKSEKHREMYVDIPVRYQKLPTGTVIAGDVPSMIRLKLRGSKMRMAKMDDEFFSPYPISLQDATMGQNTHRIYPEDFKVPFGVMIDRIQPEVIHINLAKSVIKAVPVHSAVVGTPAPGYQFKSIQLIPDEVQIRSYPQQLEQIQHLRTEEVSLEDRSRSFEGDFRVELDSPSITLLNPTVHVKVEIEEKSGTETILSVPIRWDENDGIMIQKTNAHFQPDTVSIKITGPSSKVFDLVKTPPSPMLNRKQLTSALRLRKEALIKVELPVMDSIQFEIEPRTVKLVYGRK